MSKRDYAQFHNDGFAATSRQFRQSVCPASSVRLFRILSLGYNTAPRLCLQTFPLDQCPPYVALSYTWDPRPRTIRVTGYGPDTKDTTHTFFGRPYQNKTNPNQPQPHFPKLTASINGGTYQISYHLMRGLRALQKYSRETAKSSRPSNDTAPIPNPLWIFVDAICIRQDDPHDKATQVGNMHRIFRQATTVYAWFGKGNYGIDNFAVRVGLCLPKIPQIVAGLKICIAEWESMEAVSNERGRGASDEATALLLQSDDEVLWRCFHLITHTPWFERLWIVQEAALAQEIIILASDQFSLPWSSYVDLISLAQRVTCDPNLSQRIPTALRRRMELVTNNRAFTIGYLRKTVQQDRYAISKNDTDANIELFLFELLKAVQTAFVTEPLDRVYAVLALLGDEVRALVDVDYSENAKHKYWLKWIEACQAIITIRPKLAFSLFAHASYLDRRKGLPSWCPNFEDNTRTPGTIMTWPGPSAGVREQGISTPQISIVEGTCGLEAKGFNIGQIARVVNFKWTEDAFADREGTIGFCGDMPAHLAKRMLESLSMCMDILMDTGLSLEDAEAALARCLVAQRYEWDRQPWEKLLQDYRLYETWLHYHASDVVAVDSDIDSFEQHTPEFAHTFHVQAFSSAFFVTVSGQPGLSSWKTREGDTVSIVLGLPIPYVFRTACDGKSVELVGEAYLDQNMDGEALHMFEQSQSRTRNFFIF